MEKTKVLLVTEATIGGTYTHLSLLARHLDKGRFDVSVALSPIRNTQCFEDRKMFEQSGVSVFYVAMQRRIALISDLRSTVLLYRLIKREKFDVVHLHSSKAGFLGRLAVLFIGSPSVIYSPHCYYFQSKEGIKHFFFKKLEQLVSFKTDFLVNVSEAEREITVRENIIDVKRTVFIKNAVALKALSMQRSEDEIKQKYGIDPSKAVVTGVGRLSHQKDWVTFVRIAREVLTYTTTVVFIIAGEGEFRQMIHGLIDELDISQHVILAGQVADMNELYGITDILLNTSLWEGMPYALLEAMSFSLPLITTDIPGNRELVIKEHNGFLFPPQDYICGGKYVVQLLEDKRSREQLGKNGSEFLSKNHDLNIFITKHEKLYSGCTTSN